MEITNPQTLLEEARRANMAAEEGLMSLAIALYQVDEQKAYSSAGYESTAEYARVELGRDKGTVSKMVQVGRFVQTNPQLDTKGANITTTYLALTTDETDPERIIALAKTNTATELRNLKKDADNPNCTHEDLEDWKKCKCGRFFKAQ